MPQSGTATQMCHSHISQLFETSMESKVALETERGPEGREASGDETFGRF